MQILGEIKIQGKPKKLLLKEEDGFFKYYILEWIGAYSPKVKEQKIIFKKEIAYKKETQIEIIKLVNDKITFEMLQANEIFQIIGWIAIEGKQKQLLAKRDGEILRYYLLNLIGVYSPKIPGETIIFKEDTLRNSLLTEIKDKVQNDQIETSEKEEIKQFLEKIKIRDFLEKKQEQERIQYQKCIPINTKNVKEQKQEEKQELKKEDKQRKQQKQPQKTKNKLGDIAIKQEVDMDTKVTDMSNLEQVLQKNKKMPSLEQGDEPLKMGIVESDDLKKLKNEKGEREQGHTSRYEAVMITKQGNIHSLDLDNDTQEGTNPMEKNYQVKQNDSVKKADVLTRLKVGKGTIGIEKGQYGEVEVYHSQTKTIGGNGVEGNKSLDRQLETSNAKNTLEGTNTETLKLAQEYQDGYRSVEAGYQEVESHKEQHADCEPKSVKDLDGNVHTKSHEQEGEEFVQLSTGEKISYNQLASRWGFYKDGKPDASFVKEKFSKKQQEDKKAEEVIAELDEEYEDPRTSGRGR